MWPRHLLKEHVSAPLRLSQNSNSPSVYIVEGCALQMTIDFVLLSLTSDMRRSLPETLSPTPWRLLDAQGGLRPLTALAFPEDFAPGPPASNFVEHEPCKA